MCFNFWAVYCESCRVTPGPGMLATETSSPGSQCLGGRTNSTSGLLEERGSKGEGHPRHSGGT